VVILTAYQPYIGYENATEVAPTPAKTKRPKTELLVEKGLFSEDEIMAITRPGELTTPGIAGLKYIVGKRGGKRDGA
jgi:aspartate ammonia-lyase